MRPGAIGVCDDLQFNPSSQLTFSALVKYPTCNFLNCTGDLVMLTLIHKTCDPGDLHKTASALEIHEWSEERANSGARPR